MTTQNVARKTRISDNMLAFIVIAAALILTFSAEFLTALLGSKGALIGVYIVPIVVCCWIVKRRSVSFRYGVDGKQFYLDKRTGRREKSIECVGRKEITGFYAPGEHPKEKGEITLVGTVHKKETAWTICYSRNGRAYRMLIHPNEQIAAAIRHMLEK